MRQTTASSDRYTYLATQYFYNTCTKQEMEELFFLTGSVSENQLHQVLYEYWEKVAQPAASGKDDLYGVFLVTLAKTRSMDDDILKRQRQRLGRRRALAFAAGFIIIVLASTALYSYVWKNPAAAEIAVAPRYRNDVQPGSSKALLILSDGSSIALDDRAGNGTLSVQGNIKLLKLNNGRLSYSSAHHANVNSPVLYNKITTPRGGQYQIILGDGSKVWLNSSSSLRFPVVFNEKNRKVEVSGEAYFEVASNSQKPFQVDVFSREAGQGEVLEHIQVLGTRFNVMAYPDEAGVRTTLLEGAIRLDSVLLKPGDQTQSGPEQAVGVKAVEKTDLDAVVAWKNGLFDFNKADIQTIMRQLSRWYDVQVDYRGNSQGGRQFWGGIQRDLPLSAVFSILEKSGINFSIDGKKVVVDL